MDLNDPSRVSPRKPFVYGERWYSDVVRDELKDVKTSQDILRVDSFQYRPGSKKDRYIRRMYTVNGKLLPLSGHGLEAGFCEGHSLYWLVKYFPGITIDGFDFTAEASNKLITMLKELYPCVKDLWIGDVRSIPKQDSSYDFINCCDFLEHLPDDVYFVGLKELHRVLKPRGVMGVVVGRGNVPEHVRRVSAAQTIRELQLAGFSMVHDNLFTKTP